jgi:hypothetical protein
MNGDSILEWLQQNFLSILQIAVLAIQIYTVYRIERKKLGVEKYVDIIQKSELFIAPRTHTHKQKEIIEILNKGILPISETKVNIGVTIHQDDGTEELPQMEYRRKTVLNPNEKMIIPLYEKLEKLLEERKLIRIRTVDLPSGEEDIDGEPILYEEKVKDLRKPFSITLSVQARFKVHEEIVTRNKSFRLEYLYNPEYFTDPTLFQYMEDYHINIREIMGKWQ